MTIYCRCGRKVVSGARSLTSSVPSALLQLQLVWRQREVGAASKRERLAAMTIYYSIVGEEEELYLAPAPPPSPPPVLFFSCDRAGANVR